MVVARTRAVICAPSTPRFAVIATAGRTRSEFLPVVLCGFGDLGDGWIVGSLPVRKEVDVFETHEWSLGSLQLPVTRTQPPVRLRFPFPQIWART